MDKPGVNPMNSLQASFYKLVNTNVLNVTCSYWCQQIQSKTGNIHASHPAAPSSNPGSADIFSPYCLFYGQY